MTQTSPDRFLCALLDAQFQASRVLIDSHGAAATALAAGNRVMIKPSELKPHRSGLLALLLRQAFSVDEICVVQGGADVAHEFASLPPTPA